MNKSESIKNLSEALSKFQSEVTNPNNTATNPFFKSKYAPLNDILNLVRPILSKNGLSIVQSPCENDGMVGVSTMLLHETGEYIEFDPILLKTDKQTAQGAGSAITYARRYALSAILGISSEDDDDGNGAEPSNPQHKLSASKTKASAQKTKAQPKMDKEIIDNSLASEDLLNQLYNLAGVKNFSAESMKSYIKTRFNKGTSKELTKLEASEILQMLKEM